MSSPAVANYFASPATASLAEPSKPAIALVGSWREFPIPRHLIPAAVLLIDLEYTAPAIDAILTHLNRYGSAVGCPWVDREHRDAVEATLPMDPAWDNPAWDDDVWNAVEDGDGDECDSPTPSGSRELVAC